MSRKKNKYFYVCLYGETTTTQVDKKENFLYLLLNGKFII